MRNSESGLFVDDVALWISEVIFMLNAELTRIYSWSVFNQMVFDFKKFHLFVLGVPLSQELRSQVMFGEGHPGWSNSAGYLGLTIDSGFTFLPHLRKVCARVRGSSWRIFNHDDLTNGCSPRNLEIIFLSWILLIIEYGSPVWVFRLKQCVHYSYPVLSDYKDVFEELECLYINFAKAILGLDPSTSNIATLVRLGWMPLDYLLAYRAAVWYMKIRLGLAGDALSAQCKWISLPENDEGWVHSCFYQPAHDFICRMDSKLLELSSIRDFREQLRVAIFGELSTCWRDCSHARICHYIHPEWTALRWSRLVFSRKTCCWYHQIAVGCGKFNDRNKYTKLKRSTKCRFGCDVIETVSHIFFDCVHCTDDITALRLFCREKRLTYDIRTLFTKNCLQNRVEMFLSKVFSDRPVFFFLDSLAFCVFVFRFAVFFFLLFLFLFAVVFSLSVFSSCV